MAAVRVRPEGPADVQEIRELLAEACGGDADWVRLVELLWCGDAWLPELSMLAETNGLVASYALLTRVTVGARRAPALALGPVAVRPSVRRQGYGTTVIQGALDAAAELGERLVLGVGEPALLGRFGFEPAQRLGLTSAWPAERHQALVLPTYDELAGALPQGQVHYPAAWSAVGLPPEAARAGGVPSEVATAGGLPSEVATAGGQSAEPAGD